MGMLLGGSGKGGIVSQVNVVPLIDILLVLLVIFMIMPHRQTGLPASLPQEASEGVSVPPHEPIVVQIASDGSVRVNGSLVQLDDLPVRLERIFALRAHRVAFLQGDCSLEFQVVAQVLNVMHVAGASPVGLLTSELEKNR
jgi:biopolymer transport protein TolR